MFLVTFHLLKSDPSGKKFVAQFQRFLKNRFFALDWKTDKYLDESLETRTAHFTPENIGIFAHIFYKDYAERLSKTLEKYDKKIDVFVSTSSSEILTYLVDWAKKADYPLTVKMTPNRGRNFGPLLVAFSSEIATYEYIIHVHSKRSTHQRTAMAESWANRAWFLLLENEDLRNRAIGLLSTNKDLNLVSPLVSDLISPISFSWLHNERFGSELSLKLDLNKEVARFPFPAGGMFLARTSALLPLFELNWRWEDFPEEKSQIDGTPQHAIERAIGLLVDTKGESQIFYDLNLDSFTNDYSFVSADLH